MLARFSEINPEWMARVAKMHSDSLRRLRDSGDNHSQLKAEFKQRRNQLDRLAANGYPEVHGHWNIHELLETHSGDWENVLSRLRDMGLPPAPQEEDDGG